MMLDSRYNRFFIMDEDHNPIRLNRNSDIDMRVMGEWVGNINKRRVDESNFNGCRISTVFLCIDHNFNDRGEPLLFETMVFTRRKGSYKKFDTTCFRYTTWEDAQTGHDAISYLVKHKDLTKLAFLVL